jgi:hypothetical protein
MTSTIPGGTRHKEQLVVTNYLLRTRRLDRMTMAKRSREDDDDAGIAQSGKRYKPSSPDRLSSLSDELLVKVLSFLSVSQLLVCQRYVSFFIMSISLSGRQR